MSFMRESTRIICSNQLKIMNLDKKLGKYSQTTTKGILSKE